MTTHNGKSRNRTFGRGASRPAWIACVATSMIAAALSVGAFLPPTADALASTCTPSGRGAAAAPLADDHAVFGLMSWMGGAGYCGLTGFTSLAAPCPPPPFVGAIYGAFCGPMIPAGAAVTCDWSVESAPGPVVLVVGLELGQVAVLTWDALTWDGNIGPSISREGHHNFMFGPFTAGSWKFVNPESYEVRVIAYPSAPGDKPAVHNGAYVSLVNCE